MKSRPLVSVVIPCYNLGAYLEEAVGSVETQTYQHWEIIVVDDGSTDSETTRTVDIVARRSSRIRVVHQSNQGLAAARNNGIKQAKGVYVTCLDADDKFEATYLEKTVGALDKDLSGHLAVATTWLKEFGGREDVWRTGDYDDTALLVTNMLHAASLFRKSVWEKVGGYKKQMAGGYEDWEFWLSIQEAGYIWACIPEPLFRYRIREGSMLAGSRALHNELYGRLYDLHSHMFSVKAREFSVRVAAEMKKLRDTLSAKELHAHEMSEQIREYAEQVQAQSEAIEDLEKRTGQLQEELTDLRTSRLISKMIRLRAFVGGSREKIGTTLSGTNAALRRSIHYIRVALAPYVPAPLRRAVKRLYAKARRAHIQYRIVDNTRWKSDAPLLCVVIPYYNRGDTIGDTLDSLARQTYRAFETIVVDDGSTDKQSIQKLHELKEHLPGIKVVHQYNSGVAAARNAGIALSASKYVVCLDADDILDTTFLEKGLLVLETSPGTSLVTTHVEAFGVKNEKWKRSQYDPLVLYDDNMIITAAVFTRQAWENVGGYKSDMGYEDWDFWLSLAEKGFWGKLLPEYLFKYRTALQSRYVDDKKKHRQNMEHIRHLHPSYKRNIRALVAARRNRQDVISPKTALLNLSDPVVYASAVKDSPKVLIAIPWMTFGGAETLIYNFCREVNKNFHISFVTGLDSSHEWEYKFKEISQEVYHLANLFPDRKLYLEFISNYITTRDIQILHIIHTSFVFDLLAEIKKRHPGLKVIVTVFNDRAEHFQLSVDNQKYIDAYSADNGIVVDHYSRLLPAGSNVYHIPNGINCYDVYNPELFNRDDERKRLGVDKDEIALFFIGRLSEEKNPDVFLSVAESVLQKGVMPKAKFFVIGDGAMRPYVEKKIKEINSPRVVYLGYQSEVARYLSAADLFILPSSIEGFPLSLLEAMAMQVVPIASKVGGVPDLIDDGLDGYIISPPGSASAILDTVKYLHDNPKKMASMKHGARKKVEGTYSNITLGKNYSDMYHGLL